MDGTLRAQLGPARAVRPTSLVSIASTSSGGSEFATAPPLESDRSLFDSNGFPFPRSPTSGTFPVLYEEEEPSAPVPAVLNPRHALMRLRRTSLPLNTAQTSRSVVGGSASPNFLSKGKNRMSVASLSSVGSFESLPEEEDECDQEDGRSGMEPSRPPHRTQSPFAADGRPVLARLTTFPADNAFPAPGGRPPVVPRSSAPAAIPYHGGYQAFAIPRGASGFAVRSPLSRRNSVGPATLDDDDLRGALLGERLERGRVRTKSAEGGTPEDAARREDRRWRIALELRETERAYCEVLEDIDKHYYQPLLGALPISPLASRRASRHSTPTSPTISPISLPSSPVFGPLKRMSAYMPTSPLSPATDWTATPQILARREIGEIFANFPDVVSLSRVMLETLEATVPDRASDPLPVSPPAKDRSPFGHAPELSSSTDTLESDGPGTPREGDAGDTSSAEQSPEPWLNGVNAPPLRLGKSLLPILPFLRSYSFFISNFSAALSRLSSLESPASMHGASTASPSPTEDRIKWQRFTEERRRSGVGRGLGLSSLLLNIVQRIPRYRMLLADLVKYTEPEHVDYRDLCTAFQVVEGVANFLENEIQAHTNVLQILDLQRSLLNLDAPLVLPGRRLIKIGQLVKLDRRGNQQNRTFFLLNDLLLYAAGDESWRIGIGLGFGDIGGERPPSPSRRGHAGTDGAGSGPWAGLTAGGVAGGAVRTGLRFCRRAGIYDVTVVSVEDGLEGGRKFGFEILTSEKSFSVYASSYEEKQDWIDAIRNAKSDFLRDRRTLLKDGESTLRRARRERQTSLLVTPSALRPNPTTPPRGPRFGVIPPTPSEEIAALVLDAPLETLTDEGDDAPIPFPTSPLPPASLAPASSTTPPRPNLRVRRWSDMSISAAASVLSPTVTSQAGSLDLAPLVQVRVIENYHAPVFVPDSRVARCSRCSEPFGFWRRRHHCRICGGVVCWACSTKTFIIPSDNEATPNRLARACDPCYQSSFSVPVLGHVALVVATADLFPATEQLAASLAEGVQGECDAAAAPAGSGAQGGTRRADRRLSARDQLSLLLGRLG